MFGTFLLAVQVKTETKEKHIPVGPGPTPRFGEALSHSEVTLSGEEM